MICTYPTGTSSINWLKIAYVTVGTQYFFVGEFLKYTVDVSRIYLPAFGKLLNNLIR